MADYNFSEIEKKWQKHWESNGTYQTSADSSRPKYYVLDMFPYPSGAGLHVGHPLGYIASDIVARYKRIKGFNVLHPMGFDAFGLPAEQYAIQTGQHPAITTEQNINRYKEQLKNIGLSYDWSREIRTSEPDYYKWTQWIFMQLFNSWYNNKSNKAEHIDTLISEFGHNGNKNIDAACDEDTPAFTAAEWQAMSPQQQADMLLKYRLTYLAYSVVNWCPALGTVLANDEVKDGVSERGGYPVERKRMRQWSMRITAYAERLLQGLEGVDFPEPIKEMQRNWIGKSIGAELDFQVENSENKIRVFTTRVDTIFGVTFMVLAPEHELVPGLTTQEQKAEVEAYVEAAKNRSERERMADVKTVSGVFTGSYAINPISGERTPVWIADYVLAGYGTGAVMAVPGHDSRDWTFARHFNLPVKPVVEGGDVEQEAYDAKEGTIINSGFLNGLSVKEAIAKGIEKAESLGVGTGKVNYRLRDAVFSRQRYWGEPVPVYFKDNIPHLLDENELPLLLPEIDQYLPTETGEPPLGRATGWKHQDEYEYELSTMPGWAGSSWYFYRYMDAQNDKAFAAQDAVNYWEDVDLYIGGSEHATGHLLYSRFWNKFMYDIGYVIKDEPYKKLINQGMIQGRSNFVYRIKDSNTFVSYGLKDQYQTTPLYVDVNIVSNDVLDMEAFKKWRPDFANAEFILEDGKYICGFEVEKMSKSRYNVVSPDNIVERFGADTLRLYEMFLGPLEQSKPWNTNGIDGVFKFLRKYWRLFHDEQGNFSVSDTKPTPEELKALHKTIKKVEEDIERFSFNTSVSTFMICVNELQALKSSNRQILQDLTIVLSPYAPHITEEIWHLLGKEGSISQAAYPAWNEAYLQENSFEYPISINGKTRHKLSFPADKPVKEIEDEVLASEAVQKWLEGKTPKKVIIVPKKIVNIVI
jgi:leucyl-tRNA synthetase